MDASKCCDDPFPGYGCPAPDGDGTTDALCGTCGHDHGKMTPEKATELFKALRAKPDTLEE